MIDGFSLLTLAHHQRPSSHDNVSLRHATLRRKSAHLWDTTHGATSGYPSPPMSSPPSPSRRPSNLTLPSTRGEQFLPISTNPPLTSSTPEHSLQQTTSPSAGLGPAKSDAPAYHPPASFATGLGTAVTFGSSSGPYASTQYAPPPPVSHQRTTSHDARKAKTHVASACVNCKRAHLSCDVQRPCARCVASGKQDTCYDVAHKKRGRPRLRDESQLSSERSLPATNASISTTAPLTTPTRPIAATRQRRAESFRSIQSMTSEESSSYGPPTPSFPPRPSAPFQTPLTYQPPAHLVMSPQVEPEVPTAFVDLDFVIIRANQSFRQIMADDHDLTRSRLHGIAAPADAESFMSIRSRLRGEREAREPSFLPPIVPSGEDPLAGVADSDVESFTRGFSDHTYTWVQLKPGLRAPQTFPARVRLAKAATYFVVITLPSFRPMEPVPPLPPQPQHQAPSPYSFGPPLPPSEEAMREHQRQTFVHSAPPSFYYPVEMAHPQPRYLHRRAPSFSRTYPPPQIHYPPTFQQPQPQPLQQPQAQPPPQPQPQYFLPSQPILASSLEPRRPVTDISAMASSPYIPTTAMLALPPSMPRDTTQLPPMTSSALASTLGPSSMPPIHATPSTTAIAGVQRSSESDEDSEERRLRSPRKRRRMGIDEVLQK